MHTVGCGQICVQVQEAGNPVVFVFQRGTVETLAGNLQGKLSRHGIPLCTMSNLMSF